jgi:hypothetical protein
MTSRAGLLVVLFASAILAAPAGAQSINGTPDNTAGVYLFSAGGSSGTCTSPLGTPAAQPTDDIVESAVSFNLLEFVGDQSQEVDTFTAGANEGSSDVDHTLAEVVEGLTQIDDFGVIGGAQDDSANFDAGTGGSATVGLRAIPSVRSEKVIRPDGVTATGTLGPAGAGNAAAAEAALGGFEIFIFEDGELSGMTIRLTSPTNDISIVIDDRQVDPNTQSGADDTLIAIDLDSLPGFDGTFIQTIKITDDGMVMSNSPCPRQGETSIEIDAIAVRASATATLIQVAKTANPTSVAAPGGPVTFTVRVDNSSTLNSVTIQSITDSVYGNLNGQGNCSVPQSLNAGQFYQCAFSASVTGNAGDSEVDVVNVSGTDSGGSPVSGGDNATVIITGIEVDKSAVPDTVVAPGGNVTFNVQIHNPSAIGVTVQTLTDNVHGNLNGQGSCSVPQSIPSGGTYGCAFSASVAGVAGGSEIDVVTASGVDADGNAVGDADDAVVSIVAPTATATPTITPTPPATSTPPSTATPTDTIAVADTSTPLPTPTDTPPPTSTSTPTATRTPILPDGSLVIFQAQLRYDDSPGADNGKAILRGFVDDNDTGGQLEANLLSNNASIEVTDSGLFSAVMPISGCSVKKSGIIKCKSADKTIKAIFKPTFQGPLIYMMRVKGRRLTDVATGAEQPSGPRVSGVLVQGSLGRADVIGDVVPCASAGAKSLKCKEQ